MTTRLRIACCILVSLAGYLSACATVRAPAPQRVVRARVLADEALRNRSPQWARAVNRLVEAASDHFEREFGVRIVAAAVTPWAGANSSSTAEIMTRLKGEVPLRDKDGAYDLIIAVTGEPINVYRGRARVDRIGNCRDGLGNYVVVAMTEPIPYGPDKDLSLDAVALVHELGHIFGAEHAQKPDSIMHEDFDYHTEFDAQSRTVILKNRFCPFGAKRETSNVNR